MWMQQYINTDVNVLLCRVRSLQELGRLTSERDRGWYSWCSFRPRRLTPSRRRSCCCPERGDTFCPLPSHHYPRVPPTWGQSATESRLNLSEEPVFLMTCLHFVLCKYLIHYLLLMLNVWSCESAYKNVIYYLFTYSVLTFTNWKTMI